MADARTIPEVNKERAGQLIGTAWDKHLKIRASDKERMEDSIAVGKDLLEARDVYSHDDTGKRQWGRKLKEHWKEKSTRMAYRYMDLANYETVVRADFDTRVKNDEWWHWSLRSALDAVAKEKNKGNGEGEQNQSNKPPASKSATPDLAATLQNVAPDEIGSVIDAKWDDANKRLLFRRLAPTSPKDLIEEAKGIIGKLNVDQLEEIAKFTADLIEQNEKANV